MNCVRHCFSFFKILGFCYILQLPIVATGQLNSDQQYIKEHKIKQATITENGSSSGIVLYYDEQGRLQKTIFFYWQRGMSDVEFPAGSSSITTYDTLGRISSVVDCSISDSADIYTGKNPVQISMVSRYEYPDNSTIIQRDTSWDYYGRLEKIMAQTTTINYLKLPARSGDRPIFYPDSIISSQLILWSTTTFAYSDESLWAQAVTRNGGGCLMFHRTLDGSNLNAHLMSDRFEQDSTLRCEITSRHTLHGTKHDTAYSSYLLKVNYADTLRPAKIISEQNHTTFYEIKKRGKVYHIRFQGSISPQVTKVKSKEPWSLSVFSMYPNVPELPIYNNYETLDYYTKSFNAKPVLGYWE